MIMVERDGSILVRNSSFLKQFVCSESGGSRFEEFLFNNDLSLDDSQSLDYTSVFDDDEIKNEVESELNDDLHNDVGSVSNADSSYEVKKL